ncbi:putative RNA recognition motif domain-containing protein [Lupinus albus]|uniref:Putative RNA recognition motif domain-containing protein n=1 Tax=Lupinus albus TaxID=3870 RepID=A0A6A4NBE7_LUPAL|nr:putative RNA recognition motif domain-containing protein [Lupinus albus]
MDEGESGDPMDQFHRNEAISAVADDGFLAEEDDDYDDLYNDVNVGEGFLQSFNNKNNNDLGFRNDDVKSHSASMPPVSTGGGVVDGLQNQGFIGDEVSVKGSVSGGGIRVELGQSSLKLSQVEEKIGNDNSVGVNQPIVGVVGSLGNEGLVRESGGNLNRVGGNEVGINVNAVSNVNTAGGGTVVAGGGGGGTVLFVGDLHWWTTDAELEAVLCKYGPVKEVKFFDEKASGKSKGYCQVDFFDPHVATACKEGMNGHMFNGRPCVVAYASPYTVKKMGEAQVNKNQQGTQSGAPQPVRRGPAADVGPKPGGSNVATTGNYQGGDGNNRGGYGRGIMGNGGNGFGQGIGPAPPMMHPQLMMNQGFDPAFGGPMGRMGGYGGFPGGPMPPFSGMLPSFPGVGLPGVAPHVNPAFFGRGMPMNGMGMMPTSGMDGPNMGMWPDPSMDGWGGEEHGGSKAAESSYGEEAASDHQYGEASHDRTGWTNNAREKDRGPERDLSGTSERWHRDDRDQGYERDAPREKDTGHDNDWSERSHHDDREMSRERVMGCEQSRDRDRGRERDRERDRDRYKDERNRYADHHRHRDREAEHEDEWERGRSTRARSKSRLSQEDDHHSWSRDADYRKRRRLTSE